MGRRSDRDRPCPCGTGKPRSRCCGRPRAPSGRPGEGAAGTDGDRVRALFEFATGTFGEEYRPADTFAGLGGDPDMLEFFVPWALYHYRVRGKTVADHYYDTVLKKIDPFDVHDFIAYFRPAHALLSIWEVVESRPGEGLRLRDLVAGYEEEVVERTASRALRRWQVLLARVSFGLEPQIFGLHPRTLPPREGAAAVEEVSRALGGRPGKAGKLRLQHHETAGLLIRAWEQAAFEYYDFAPPPRLTNTDGDPLRPTIDRFELARAARDDVAARLKALTGAVVDEETPKRLRASLTRPGNAMNPSWTNTIVGRADLGRDSLVLETNSEVRADTLRKYVETACGDALRHAGREASPPPAVPGPGAHLSRSPTRPEHLSVLRDFKDRDYRAWLDTPIPALGDATPREAARNRRRRRGLVLLLKEIEHQEEGLPTRERFDATVLWKELGIQRS